MITGATAGIGLAFARSLAAAGHDLVLNARDAQRLEQVAADLRSASRIDVEILAADLSDRAQCLAVEVRLSDPSRPIEILINNAGFGINSTFLESEASRQAEMINTMIMAPMHLTHSVGLKMKERSKGFIINISSVAGFMAGSTYCAAKSWLNVFTESIHEEYNQNGVNVHAICPGFTRTDFHKRCNQDVSGVPDFFWLTSDYVARKAWEQVLKGKTMSVPTVHYKLLVAVHQFAPRWLVIVYGKIAKAFLARSTKI